MSELEQRDEIYVVDPEIKSERTKIQYIVHDEISAAILAVAFRGSYRKVEITE